MRRTKIVCTIGPASDSPEIMKKLIEAGMNVARLNFSHGTHEEHRKRLRSTRQIARELGSTLAIMLDTKGPEIRTGTLKNGSAALVEGRRVTLTVEQLEGDAERVPVKYPALPRMVRPGNSIMIADGLIGLKVIDTSEKEVVCEVTNGGELGNNKGINIPGVAVDLPAITGQDVLDIDFGIEEDVDFIAASFVRMAADVLDIRKLLEARNANIDIIAKIENHQGVENVDDIIKVSDGVMVARGDLGVEIPSEEVPLVQKMIIEKCNKAGKPVITATQMLESMVRNPRPTRAEASDVANAIFDGTDAIMLSGETAAGRYPVESVRTMARIAERAEEALRYEEILGRKGIAPARTVPDAISHATCTIALDLGAAAIITSTESGSTARMVSKYRPWAPIIAGTQKEKVMQKLSLVWGVIPLQVVPTSGTDEMIEEAVSTAIGAGLVKPGDLVVITAGVPIGVPGTTNLVKVHIVGKMLLRGTGVGTGVVRGVIRTARSPEEALAKVQPGDILVASVTDRDYVPAIEKAHAVITEVGGLTSHAAVVGVSLGVPVVCGAEGALAALQDGQMVTIDVRRGLVLQGEVKVV